MSETAGKATPHSELMLSLMDCRIPKSELEHAAVIEIASLQDKEYSLTNRITELEAQLAKVEGERDRLENASSFLMCGLMAAQIGSCNCFAKSINTKDHDDRCRYKSLQLFIDKYHAALTNSKEG